MVHTADIVVSHCLQCVTSLFCYHFDHFIYKIKEKQCNVRNVNRLTVEAIDSSGLDSRM